MQGKVKILIVEDQQITALDLKKQLEGKFEITGIVSTGSEAINIVQKTKPDLVLMDILIDGNINGIETASFLTKKYDIRVIFITALGDDETFLEAKRVSPHGFITKPFNNIELLKIITRSLKRNKNI